MNKIPVGKTIAYAYSFTFGHLGTVIGLTWLPFLLITVANYFVTNALYVDAGGGHVAATAAAATTSAPAARLGTLLIGIGSYVLLVFLNAVVAVAIVRQALGLRTGGALVHLAAGRDEWRMFWGHVRYMVALITVLVIFYLAVLVIGLVVGILIGAAGVQQQAAMGVVGLAAMAGTVAVGGAAIYAIARMGFLLSPSIASEKGGGIKRSYDLTKGNFWRMAGIWMAVGFPLLALLLLAEYAFLWSHFHLDMTNLPAESQAAVAELSRRFNEAMAQVQAEMVRQNLTLQAVGFVYSVFAAGLSYSASSFAYRALVPVGAGH